PEPEPEPEPAPAAEEAPAPAVSDDPNKMMGPDDIAALLASMGGDEASAEETAAEETPVEEPAPEVAEPEAAAEEAPAEEAPAPAVSDDPNKMMGPDDIAALLASMGGDEAPAEETAAEETPAEEPIPEPEPEPAPAAEEAPASAVSDDPNKMMSPDDIAALLASMGGDESPAEETAAEEAAPEAEPEAAAEDAPAEEASAVSDDPNKMMSPDDIAALLASMGGDESPAEETAAEEAAPEAEPEAAAEEAPAEEAPAVSDDPNKMMSPDDIEALLASMGDAPFGEGEEWDEPAALAEDSPAEKEEADDKPSEDAPAKEVAPEADSAGDDPNKSLSPDDIAALFAASGESDAVIGGGQLERGKEEASEDSSGASLEDMAALLEGSEEDELLSLLNDTPESGAGEAMDMGLDDIEKQLAMAEAAGKEEEPSAVEAENGDDMAALLATLGEDDVDLSDIGDLLQKSDNNELVDPSIMESKEAPEAGEEEEEGGKKKKKERKKRVKKKKGEAAEGEEGAEKPKKEKKPGFFAKLFELLTAEAEGDEERDAPKEAGQTKLSDENADILSEIDAEKDKDKGKKKKKEKPPKEKKEKPKKEKKPPKPKKEKPEEPADTKRIPKKYIMRTVMLAFSILVALMVVTMYMPSLMNMQEARDAYYNDDYKTAFLSLYGKDLNESDQLIYRRSRLLVMLDRKYESYEHYMNMNMPSEALDALLQGLKRCDELEREAQELEVTAEALQIRIKILSALQNTFGLSEAQAEETLSYSTADYTGKIHATVNGEAYLPMKEEIFGRYDLLDAPEPEPPAQDELPDMLPEEKEYLENNPPAGPDEGAAPETPPPAEGENEGNGAPPAGDATDGETPVELRIESEQF
ncbi:MAG: hypothetical protein IK115_06880, partial [Lachnospiraceae bacterium]|nr:hypothetical protein [Lachnospiraceae bacterium]